MSTETQLDLSLLSRLLMSRGKLAWVKCASVHAHGSAACIIPDTHFFYALMSGCKIDTTVAIPVQYILDIRTVAPDVNIFTADCLYQSCCSPHAYAPRISWVWLRPYQCIPLPLFLASYAPKVGLAPVKRLTVVRVEKLRTDSV